MNELKINRDLLQSFLLKNNCGRELNSIYSYGELLDEIEMAIEDQNEFVLIVNSFEQEIELKIKDVLL